MSDKLIIAAATARVHLADVEKNCSEIERLSREAASKGAGVIAFPKHALCGATLGDPGAQKLITSAVSRCREKLASLSDELGVAIVLDPTVAQVGDLEVEVIPAAEPELVCSRERIRARLSEASRGKVVVWANAGCGESTTDYVFAGGSMIYAFGKCVAEGPSFARQSSIVYAEINPGEKAEISEEILPVIPDAAVSAHPFVPDDAEELSRRCRTVLDIQTAGLAGRLESISCRSAVVGISGGLDSTLALLVTVRAFDMLGLDRKGIVAVTMPGFGTSDRTHDNASALMLGLGVSSREICIEKSVSLHLQDIGHPENARDVTYENAQARERTQILMDIANQCGGIVVGTGDLSEIALGWCTYNGDHMSMYSVNSSVPKTMMRAVVVWAARNEFTQVKEVLLDIVDTPVSPELLPGVQPTEDIVGPYELHDYFLYHIVRCGETPRELLESAVSAFDGVYDRETVLKWLKKFLGRFFSQQFKRNCSPDGPAVGTLTLSPRIGWRSPSDVPASVWVDDLD